MEFIISKHPKGIIISGQRGISGLSTTGLRRMLGVSVSPLSKNTYLVPVQFAYAVLENFGIDKAEWDAELLQIASKQAYRRDAQLHAQVEVEYAIENAKEELNDYPLLGRLDSHQVEAVAAVSVSSLQGMAIFDEQGTGKTVMALCGFDRLRQKELIDRLLIVAPKSVLGSWKNDAEMLFGNSYSFQTVAGSAKKRRKQLLSKHDILVIGYETALNEQSLLKVLLLSGKNRYLLVVDESYYVKNPDAKRTRLISEIRAYCERAIVLCGTPAPNSPRDLVQQINITDEGLAFEHRDIPKDKQEAHSIVENALHNAIYLRRLKHDVFPDISKKEIERLTFDLQPVQRSLYDQVLDETVFAIRNIDDAQFARQLTSFLARRVTLLQICSHPGAVDPLYEETPVKHLVLDRLLEELVEKQEKKVVIWSYFRHSLQALTTRYAHYGVVRIDGSVTGVEDRVEAIRRFQQDYRTKIFIGNAAAAGAGITLTAAHHAIYESFSNQAAHYMQSVDRIHRRGQEHDVTYHVLLAHDTVEEREFDRILEKERTGRDLLGDIYEEPMTRERFLAELGALN